MPQSWIKDCQARKREEKRYITVAQFQATQEAEALRMLEADVAERQTTAVKAARAQHPSAQ